VVEKDAVKSQMGFPLGEYQSQRLLSENETGHWRSVRQTQRAIASDGAPTTIKRRMGTLVVNAKETLVTSKSIILPHARGDTELERERLASLSSASQWTP
jgi:hypothetical protein